MVESSPKRLKTLGRGEMGLHGLYFQVPKEVGVINPLPDNKILGWAKFKQIADDILKCI